jgi:serine/threonine-protein kinase
LAKVNGQDIVFFSEEWIEGETLSQMLASNQQLPTDEVVKLADNVTRAIKAVWSARKIHRDVKPSNIIRRDSNGDYVLLDMGIAFDVDDISLTEPLVMVGTVPFFSPEQANYSMRRQMDFRSDLFALGSVLYLASTGRHPFHKQGMNSTQTFISILTDTPSRPSDIHPDFPDSLERIIMRLLAKRPHLRYRTFDQLLDALAEITV